MTDPVRPRTPQRSIDLPTTTGPTRRAQPRSPGTTIDPSPDHVDTRAPNQPGIPPHNPGTRLPPPGPTTTPAPPAQDWSDAAVARTLVRELVASGCPADLADRAVRLKAREMSIPDFEALKARPASRAAVRLLKGKLERVAADAGNVRHEARVAAVARGIADRLPDTMNAWGAKVAWDLVSRLESLTGPRLDRARVVAPEFHSITPASDKVREAQVSFNPSPVPPGGTNVDGYKLYFLTEPPQTELGPWGTEANRPKTIDLGNVRPDASNTCMAAFAIDWPDAVDTYYVWITAYNNTNSVGESGKSNVLHETFKPSARGDINHDGTVDTTDVDKLLRILLGEEPAVATADVNADGVVDQRDLDALLAKIR